MARNEAGERSSVTYGQEKGKQGALQIRFKRVYVPDRSLTIYRSPKTWHKITTQEHVL